MNEHNHAWRQLDGIYTCDCGVIIDMSDPEYPQGIVRDPLPHSCPNCGGAVSWQEMPDGSRDWSCYGDCSGYGTVRLDSIEVDF